MLKSINYEKTYTNAELRQALEISRLSLIELVKSGLPCRLGTHSLIFKGEDVINFFNHLSSCTHQDLH